MQLIASCCIRYSSCVHELGNPTVYRNVEFWAHATYIYLGTHNSRSAELPATTSNPNSAWNELKCLASALPRAIFLVSPHFLPGSGGNSGSLAGSPSFLASSAVSSSGIFPLVRRVVASPPSLSLSPPFPAPFFHSTTTSSHLPGAGKCGNGAAAARPLSFFNSPRTVELGRFESRLRKGMCIQNPSLMHTTRTV